MEYAEHNSALDTIRPNASDKNIVICLSKEPSILQQREVFDSSDEAKLHGQMENCQARFLEWAVLTKMAMIRATHLGRTLSTTTNLKKFS